MLNFTSEFIFSDTDYDASFRQNYITERNITLICQECDEGFVFIDGKCGDPCGN